MNVEVLFPVSAIESSLKVIVKYGLNFYIIFEMNFNSEVEIQINFG
jgi:hypothetical protein